MECPCICFGSRRQLGLMVLHLNPCVAADAGNIPPTVLRTPFFLTALTLRLTTPAGSPERGPADGGGPRVREGEKTSRASQLPLLQYLDPAGTFAWQNRPPKDLTHKVI